jgi:hypothetical protein
VRVLASVGDVVGNVATALDYDAVDAAGVGVAVDADADAVDVAAAAAAAVANANKAQKDGVEVEE